MALSSKLRDKLNRNGMPRGRHSHENFKLGNLLGKLEVIFGSSSYEDPKIAIDGNNSTGPAIDLSGSDIAYILKVADNEGASVGNGNMFKDPLNDAEAGHIKILIGAVEYQIPFYASS